MDNQNLSSSSSWRDIFDKLFAIPYHKVDDIKQVEHEILLMLQQDQGALDGLITLMFVQTMNGNRAKAKALAHKIWDIGGAIKPFFELMYIENLLNIGLNEMAGILLKPRFEQLRENIDYFYPVMLKFALQTGDTSLLQRLGNFPDKPDDDAEELFALVDVYAELDCSSQFKNIQKIILENCLENLCAYEYELYNDRDFPEIEIFIYANLQEPNCEKLQNAIETKIAAYWQTCNRKQLYNILVTVHNTQYHDAWDADDNAETTEPVAISDYKLNW